jgi:5'-nucleotidase
MEGALLGYPALATSLACADTRTDYRPAAQIVARIVQQFRDHPLAPGTLLNINVPAADAVAGSLVSRLGRRHKDTNSVRQLDPKNRPIYWIGPTGTPGFDAGPGTDFHALANQYVSITPLQTDLTAFPLMEEINSWLNHGAAQQP